MNRRFADSTGTICTAARVFEGSCTGPGPLLPERIGLPMSHTAERQQGIASKAAAGEPCRGYDGSNAERPVPEHCN